MVRLLTCGKAPNLLPYLPEQEEQESGCVCVLADTTLIEEGMVVHDD